MLTLRWSERKSESWNSKNSNANKKKRMPRLLLNNTLNKNACVINESPNANANVTKRHIYQQKWAITVAPSMLTAWSDSFANLPFYASSSY